MSSEENEATPETHDCQSNTECKSIARMLEAMKYYESIKMDINSNKSKDKLVEFCDEQKQNVLDDYTHILMKHNDNDLKHMAKVLITHNSSFECNIKECKHALRYYRDRQNDNDNENELTNANTDLNFVFYRDVMDRMHCNVFHLYNMGMRVNINNETQTIDEDISFTKMRTLLKEQVKMLKINSSTRDNKYNIDCKFEETTFMDGLYTEMMGKNISPEKIKIFQNKLNTEEYDSDALQADIEYYQCTNIGNYLPKSHYSVIKRYIYLSTLYKSSFSTGFTFYYWQHYKESEKQHRFFANQNDHSGYKENELYVTSKYKNLKHEIVNNGVCYLPMNDFNKSLNKARHYITTAHAKTLFAECPTGLYYDIEDDTPITLWHLLSIILYTDWSELCTSFTSTFRRKISYESISCVKQRNAEYANWSRLLRETVQLFGQQGYEGIINDEGDEEWNRENNRIKGPFYCGMSFVMTFPEFNIKLCGPTSTTKQLSVANRFATDDGILITFNNYGYLNAEHLRTFWCGWISCFSMEDECLFIGGQRTIRMVTVTIVDTARNYKPYFAALFYFDCMVLGNYFEDDLVIKGENKKYQILSKLIKNKMNANLYRSEFGQYVIDTFECFVNHKTQIIIQLEILNKQLKAFRDLLITDDNMIRPIIFELFPNCKHIMIYATDSYGKIQYELDLLALLALIQTKSSFIKFNHIKISIIGAWEYYHQKTSSWIPNKFSQSIKSKFLDSGFDAQIEQRMRYFDEDESRKEDHLFIEHK